MSRHLFTSFYILCWTTWLRGIVGQDDPLRFTSGVANPAPIPGSPFVITWAGGTSTETVYIILTYLFPDLPDQVIPYINTDILSNAPNNGSWTWHVPLDINQGRYVLKIGENPFLLSDSTGVFTILPSQTSYVPPTSVTSSPAATYNGCGLPPLPDFTYTGYQPPCTVTTDGRVETLYPIVPADLSSSFFGSGLSRSNQIATTTGSVSRTASSSSSSTINAAFASGIYAQALQCISSVTPVPTTITADGTATVFSTVGCATSTTQASSSSEALGICHSSGYETFTVNSATTACCPAAWTTTPLNSVLYCFTLAGAATSGPAIKARQISAESAPTLTLSDLAFTRAGIVAAQSTSNGDTHKSQASSGRPRDWHMVCLYAGLAAVLSMY